MCITRFYLIFSKWKPIPIKNYILKCFMMLQLMTIWEGNVYFGLEQLYHYYMLTKGNHWMSHTVSVLFGETFLDVNIPDLE